MATGDITATNLGVGWIGTTAFLALITGANVGAVTAGTETSTIHIVSHGNGQASVIKLARAA